MREAPRIGLMLGLAGALAGFGLAARIWMFTAWPSDEILQWLASVALVVSAVLVGFVIAHACGIHGLDRRPSRRAATIAIAAGLGLSFLGWLVPALLSRVLSDDSPPAAWAALSIGGGLGTCGTFLLALTTAAIVITKKRSEVRWYPDEPVGDVEVDHVPYRRPAGEGHPDLAVPGTTGSVASAKDRR